ncbi:LOW QUALITY PROTEIN: probable G-protein coupled receptor 34b [Carassius gibelio]|uniref:LOW QUALITY PROTEIN: probable G-protein coupled receptor 34b n=1 Tax=Carassius gibelio TaxID=101364 RepID=UPI0022795FD4|nr:LOW QUALITY PROTEIN: probable G-protein coupled receptor 34b [Carassius gibelio]
MDSIHKTTTMSNITERKCITDNSSLQAPLAFFYALFFVFGLSGNLLALWVFLRVHPKKNSVRIFLINLALADLLLVICLPFRVVYHSNNDQWVLPPLLCRVVGIIFYVNMYISIVLLGLISVDRYLKFQRSSCRKVFLHSRWSVLLCSVIWAVASVCGTCLFFFNPGGDNSTQCFQYKTLHEYKWKAYFNFAIVGMFWLIYIALVISYAKIGMNLLTTSKNKPNFPNAAKYNKTAWKSFFVLFLFTICFVPYHLARIFYIMSQIAKDPRCESIRALDKTNEVVLLLSAFNSCLDPVMYFLFCSSIRKVLLKFICNSFCQQNVKGLISSIDTPQELPNASAVVPMTNAQDFKLKKTTDKVML